MHPPSPATVTLLALIPLIAWRVYARFRRMIGRQRLSGVRPWITLTIYSLLVLAVASAALAHSQRLWWLAGSLLLGVALAVVGLRFTKFEAVRGVGLFYTPNAHIGLALSLLFVARIAYRLLEVYVLAPALPRSSTEFMGSLATVLVFGLLAGYYLGYAVGLVRWRLAVLTAKRLREAAQADA
jgi:hypothetical protein